MPKADGHLHGTGSVVYYNLEYEKIAHRLFERASMAETSGLTARGTRPRLGIGWNCVDEGFHAWFCEEWVLGF